MYFFWMLLPNGFVSLKCFFFNICQKKQKNLWYLGLIVEGSSAGAGAENVAVNGPASLSEGQSTSAFGLGLVAVTPASPSI